jgi:hypothetical protein
MSAEHDTTRARAGEHVPAILDLPVGIAATGTRQETDSIGVGPL